jgi:tetratricopeptide (TPR) repeat protein
MTRTPEAQATPAPNASPWQGRDWLVGLLILAATLAAYHPVWSAGFIWDDKGHVTRPDLQPLHGLWRIWFEPGATQQYYPLLHSAFWLEHRMWGESARAYHLANISLHALSAFLLYALLRRLALPGAMLAALAFALHPVCVETVAWVSEEKNTLSAVFCLLSALAYLSFDARRGGARYALATALFAMAIATKSVTATLPAALLVILWWRRGRLSWKPDVLPLAPWFALATAAGIVTAWVERRFIGASGEAFALGAVGRCLVAGRALWFYLGKALWPTHLSFIYPHWEINTGAAWQYLYPAGAIAALAALHARRLGRGPIAAALLFAGTLLPALGFINTYPFLYSYVADHFQYLALAVVVSGAAAALTLGARRANAPRWLRAAAAAGLVALLARLTMAQGREYVDSETLWKATLAANPSCWMARENLGGVYLGQGRVDEAIAQFREAIRMRPADHEAMNELGVAQLQSGHPEEAVSTLVAALSLAPNSSETHLNLGVALLHVGKANEAARQFEGVLEVDPTSTKARRNLAIAYHDLAGALFVEGHPSQAGELFQKSLAMDPDVAQTHSDLGAALAAEGHPEEALAEYRRALDLDPGLSVAAANEGGSLLKLGRFDEAAQAYARATELEPRDARLFNALGIALAKGGHVGAAAEEFRRALAIDPGYEPARRNLDAVQSGR